MALIAICIIALVDLIACLFMHLRKNRACRKIRAVSYDVKVRELDDALDLFGYRYIIKGDLISTTMYPWQREMGFCRQYDEAAPVMNMVYDCEPIYFNYEGKRWLLEFWKGQYGLTTGGEIGIYVNDSSLPDDDPRKLFYCAAADEDRLQMQFVLRKKGQVIMERKEYTWWLTGFKAGEYSKACELTMEIMITFPNMAMRKAFCKGLIRAGYCRDEICYEQLKMYIRFDSPHTRQPERFSKYYINKKNRMNRRNCRRYIRITKCTENNTLDRITFFGYYFPFQYRFFIWLGPKCNRRKLRRYCKRKVKL